MASLLQQANLAENEEFMKRLARAVAYHVNYFLGVTDPLVVAKVRWCKTALNSPKVSATEIFTQIVADANISAHLDQATDAEIQAAVNAAIPAIASRLAEMR